MKATKRECTHPGCGERCRFVMHWDEVTVTSPDGTVVERGVVTSRPYIPINWKHVNYLLVKQAPAPRPEPRGEELPFCPMCREFDGEHDAERHRIEAALVPPFGATRIDDRCAACGHRKAQPARDTCLCCYTAHTGCGGVLP